MTTTKAFTMKIGEFIDIFMTQKAVRLEILFLDKLLFSILQRPSKKQYQLMIKTMLMALIFTLNTILISFL